MSDEKTEEPSEKKLRKAREEGQVAKSQDVAEVACLAAVLVTLIAGQHYLVDTMRAIVKDALDFVTGERSLQDLAVAASHIGMHAFYLLCGVALVALAAALLAMMPQTGLQISLQAIMPKFTAVDPASGITKIFSMNSMIDLAKMTVKAIVIGIVMWQTIKQSIPVVASSLDQSVPQLIGVLWSVLIHVVEVALGVFLVISAVDYKLQQWLFVRKNKMSKDEVKREHKDSEGDPHLKGERKRLAREMVEEAPKRDLSRANVVVVNPVHYAVALRYDPTEFPLPIVIAKGTDEQALELRRRATLARVPIVANPPIARMLHKVPANQPIPEELFEVVAAILRWVDALAPQTVKPE